MKKAIKILRKTLLFLIASMAVLFISSHAFQWWLVNKTIPPLMEEEVDYVMRQEVIRLMEAERLSEQVPPVNMEEVITARQEALRLLEKRK